MAANTHAFGPFGITATFKPFGGAAITLGAVLDGDPTGSDINLIKYVLLDETDDNGDPVGIERSLGGAAQVTEASLTTNFIPTIHASMNTYRGKRGVLAFAFPGGSTVSGSAMLQRVKQERFGPTKQLCSVYTFAADADFTFTAGTDPV
jgi:hypothetical protein